MVAASRYPYPGRYTSRYTDSPLADPRSLRLGSRSRSARRIVNRVSHDARNASRTAVTRNQTHAGDAASCSPHTPSNTIPSRTTHATHYTNHHTHYAYGYILHRRLTAPGEYRPQAVSINSCHAEHRPCPTAPTFPRSLLTAWTPQTVAITCRLAAHPESQRSLRSHRTRASAQPAALEWLRGIRQTLRRRPAAAAARAWRRRPGSLAGLRRRPGTHRPAWARRRRGSQGSSRPGPSSRPTRVYHKTQRSRQMTGRTTTPVPFPWPQPGPLPPHRYLEKASSPPVRLHISVHMLDSIQDGSGFGRSALPMDMPLMRKRHSRGSTLLDPCRILMQSRKLHIQGGQREGWEDVLGGGVGRQVAGGGVGVGSDSGSEMARRAHRR